MRSLALALLTFFPRPRGQLVPRLPIIKLLHLPLDLLLLHPQHALHNLIMRHLLQIERQPQLARTANQPLGRVIVVPLDPVPVIVRELVVEVVVAFAHGDEGGDGVVARGEAVGVGGFAEPVCEGVDAEGGVVDKDEAGDGGVEVASLFCRSERQ